MREIETPTAAEIAFARFQTARAIWRIRRHKTTAAEERDSDQRRHRLICPHCNPTAKAMRRVRDQWVVAGIKP
jgi:hypothetical protein